MVTAATWLGTAAASAGSHPYCLFVDGLDVIKEAGSPGSLFGTLLDTVTLRERHGDSPTLEFTIDDPGRELALASNAFVYFCDHRGRFRSAIGSPVGSQVTPVTDDLFRGRILSVTKEPIGGVAFRWHVVAVGLADLLDRRIIPTGIMPMAGKAQPGLQQLAAYYLPPEISALQQGGNDGTYYLGIEPALWINGDGLPLAHDVLLAGMTIREAMRAVWTASSDTDYTLSWTTKYADIRNGLAEVDISPQGRLRWESQTASLPIHSIVEGAAAPAGQPAPADIQVDVDVSKLCTAVYVRGVDALSSGWITNDALIAQYGRIEAFLESPAATDANTLQIAGAAYLGDHRPITRVHMVLEGAHDVLLANGFEYGQVGWHPRHHATLTSGSGYWPTGLYYLSEITTTYKAGGAELRLDLVFGGGSTSPGSVITAQAGEDRDNTRAAQRLTGTLGEVAVRSKAGVPTDADFLTPRDGFVVVDTTDTGSSGSPGVLYIRAGGAWIAVNPADPTSYQTTLLPRMWSVNAAYATAAALPISGGAMAIPMDLDSPMRLTGYRYLSRDATLARSCEIGLYRPNATAAGVLDLIAGSTATDSFVAAAASNRAVSVASPITVPAGEVWLVIRNTSGANTFGLGIENSVTLAASYTQTKTIGALGSTLDIITGWTKTSSMPDIIAIGLMPDNSTAW